MLSLSVVRKLGRFLYGIFAGVIVGILWAILLVAFFSNLYIFGILFKPIPAELFAGFLWMLLYGRFLVYLWKLPNFNFTGYIAGSIAPVLLAGFFSITICLVRASFRDGVKTIQHLEEYKQRHGHYPENADAIDSKALALRYAFNREDGSFRLIYETGLFESASYDSRTRRWRGDLPVGGVPYDILGIDQMIDDVSPDE
jgi:hypothetical protein